MQRLQRRRDCACGRVQPIVAKGRGKSQCCGDFRVPLEEVVKEINDLRIESGPGGELGDGEVCAVLVLHRSERCTSRSNSHTYFSHSRLRLLHPLK